MLTDLVVRPSALNMLVLLTITSCRHSIPFNLLALYAKWYSMENKNSKASLNCKISSRGGKSFSHFSISSAEENQFRFYCHISSKWIDFFFFYSGGKILILIAAGRKIIESERGQCSCTLKDTQHTLGFYIHRHTFIYADRHTNK